MASHLDFIFGSIFTPNLDPPNLPNISFSIGKQSFFNKSLYGSKIDFYSILMPNWLYFGVILAVLGCSGSLLGRLGRVLAPLGGLLGRLWPVLCATWRVLARLGRVLGASGHVLGASWRVLARKTSQDKPDLTWNGKRRSF